MVRGNEKKLERVQTDCTDRVVEILGQDVQ